MAAGDVVSGALGLPTGATDQAGPSWGNAGAVLGAALPFAIPARAIKRGFTVPAFHGTRTSARIGQFRPGPRLNEEGLPREPWSGDANALIGPHFAAEPEVAGKFATGQVGNWDSARGQGRGRVYPTVLKMEKPAKFRSEEDLQRFIMSREVNEPEVDMILESLATNDINKILVPTYGGNFEATRRINHMAENFASENDDAGLAFKAALATAARQHLERKGFDSIVYPNAGEGGTGYIVFNPYTQVRSPWAKFARKSGGLLAGVGLPTLIKDQLLGGSER